MSLPLRKCGLKHGIATQALTELPSLPLRKCGLKLYEIHFYIRLTFVTSLAEVWIETLMEIMPLNHSCVTSLAEVWIETNKIQHCNSFSFVTSLAEVWIETKLLNHPC